MKFSIITPSFGQLDWLRLCIASVRDQVAAFDGSFSANRLSVTNAPITVEHVVQDGGTHEIEGFAREVKAAFFRDGEPVFPVEQESTIYSLSIYSEKDQGMYDAINRGLKRSSGEVCAWLNCDEQYLPSALRHVATEFSLHPGWEMLLGDTILLNENLEARSYRPGVPPMRRYIQAFQLNVHSSSLFFRRSLLVRNFWLGTRFRSIGDAEWIARILDSGVAIQRLPLPLSTFVLGNSNLSGNCLSSEEKTKWSSELQMSGFERLMLRLRHIFRRVAFGACLPRRGSVTVFTPADLRHRRAAPVQWLDFRFRA